MSANKGVTDWETAILSQIHGGGCWEVEFDVVLKGGFRSGTHDAYLLVFPDFCSPLLWSDSLLRSRGHDTFLIWLQIILISARLAEALPGPFWWSNGHVGRPVTLTKQFAHLEWHPDSRGWTMCMERGRRTPGWNSRLNYLVGTLNTQLRAINHIGRR